MSASATVPLAPAPLAQDIGAADRVGHLLELLEQRPRTADLAPWGEVTVQDSAAGPQVRTAGLEAVDLARQSVRSVRRQSF